MLNFSYSRLFPLKWSSSTFSEKGDQECPGHDFLMSRSAVRYVLLCFFQKQGLEITVF